MLHVAPADFAAVCEAGQRWGLETALAALQILDQALTRMRQSTQVRTLLEIALVRICKLEDLDALPGLIAQLRDGTPPACVRPQVSRARREPPAEPASAASPPRESASSRTALPGQGEGREAPRETEHVSAEAVPAPTAPWTEEVARQAWRETLEEISGLKAEMAGDYSSLAVQEPNQLVVHLKRAYNQQYCERPDVKRELEQALARRAGRTIRIDFAVAAEPEPQRPEKPPPAVSRQQRMRELDQHPLVQEAKRLFDTEVIRVDERRNG